MWFLNDIGRLNQERAAIAELEQSRSWLDGVQWHFDGPNLVVDADIVLGTDKRHAIRLRFPEHYPSVLPSVRLREPTLVSDHQYGASGDLCLELGPDNWHPESHMGAHMIESTHRLLNLEADCEFNAEIEIPSRHALTAGQAQRTQFLRWVVTPAARTALNALPGDQAFRCDVYTMFHENALTVFLQRIEHASPHDWHDPHVPVGLKRLGRCANGAIITTQPGALTLTSLNRPATITTLLQDAPVPPTQKEDGNNDLDAIEYVFLKGFNGAWQAHWRWPDGEKVSGCSTLDTDTAPAPERHGLDANLLNDVTVAIVGLGSAGSKIATSLARSGVPQFVLLDDDLLHPANLVRHDSDWFGVGQHKVDAIADRLALVNPSVQVNRRKHRLQGQESSTAAASALSAIGGADLIIDATASPGVFNLCAHVARHSKTSLLWLEIYAGGIGGLVARTRPDNEAEPFTLRAAINSAANQIAEQKGVEPPEGTIDYGAVDPEQRIVIASDADVTTLAGQATQLALDTLLDRNPSHFLHPAYLVGFAKGWIFEQAFHTIPIDCSAPAEWSTVIKTDNATRDDAAAFIVKLLKEHASDADVESAA